MSEQNHADVAELREGPVEEEVLPERAKVPITRAGRVWVGLIIALVLLALLLVFIFQNLHATRLHFFTASGSFPVALALLIAAIAGALLVLIVGSLRIVQLRRSIRRGGRGDSLARAGTSTPSVRHDGEH